VKKFDLLLLTGKLKVSQNNVAICSCYSINMLNLC